MKGPLVIVSGPAGCGKSTLVGRIRDEGIWPLRLSVSATTRAPRPGEREGVHYHFWTPDRFQATLQADGFLEWADVFGNFYGTLRSEVEPWREMGFGVLLTIDVQGRDQVKRRCPDAVSVFVQASSPAVYERRLRSRGTESEEGLQKRLAGMRRELARAPDYDCQVINDDLDVALATLRAILGPLFAEHAHAG